MEKLSDEGYLHAHYIPIMALSFVVTVVSYYIVTPMLSRKYCQKYVTLSSTERADWNSRSYSTINSLLVSAFCIYDLVWNRDLQANPIWSSNAWATNIACSIMAGYMLADMIFVVTDFTFQEAVAFSIHHAVVVLGVAYTVLLGVLPYFTAYRLLAELSNPFINTWVFIVTSGYPKNHPSAVATGIAMTFAFFLCRIAAMPVYYFMVYTTLGTPEFFRLTWDVRLTWLVVSVTLDCLNILWFTKLMRGATKQLTEMKKDRKQFTNKAA
ncbi:TLC domain-containing protein 4-B-like [Ptychodera flava]|uniref:TLC domain-containing protein 4-B-like n=1 Tax=Ptychodera flava TaxID=63121 RepID=UPI00396A267E